MNDERLEREREERWREDPGNSAWLWSASVYQGYRIKRFTVGGRPGFLSFQLLRWVWPAAQPVAGHPAWTDLGDFDTWDEAAEAAEADAALLLLAEEGRKNPRKSWAQVEKRRQKVRQRREGQERIRADQIEDPIVHPPQADIAKAHVREGLTRLSNADLYEVDAHVNFYFDRRRRWRARPPLLQYIARSGLTHEELTRLLSAEADRREKAEEVERAWASYAVDWKNVPFEGARTHRTDSEGKQRKVSFEGTWSSVFGEPQADTAGAGPGPFARSDVMNVVKAVTFRDPPDERWADDYFFALFILKDGSWGYVEAWNDTTGWGCQDSNTWAIAPDLASLIPKMSDEGRYRLGLHSTPGVAKTIAEGLKGKDKAAVAEFGHALHAAPAPVQVAVDLALMSKKNPLFRWQRVKQDEWSRHAYKWEAWVGPVHYVVTPRGALTWHDRQQEEAGKETYATASIARKMAERHFAENYPLQTLALEGEKMKTKTRKNPKWERHGPAANKVWKTTVGGKRLVVTPRRYYFEKVPKIRGWNVYVVDDPREPSWSDYYWRGSYPTLAKAKAEAVKKAKSNPRRTRRNALQKGSYPFSRKQEQYARYTDAQLKAAADDAWEAVQAAATWDDPTAEGWYRDDLATIRAEQRKRKKHKKYPSHAIGNRRSRKNPRGIAYTDKPFDPRDFQIQAQVARIFTDSLRPDDTKADLQVKANRAWAITVRRAQEYGFFLPGTKTPTPKTAMASKLRYAGKYVGSDKKVRDLTDLVNSRQAYETMLGSTAKGNEFYRATAEPTKHGMLYFIWPLPPGARIPGPASKDKKRVLEIVRHLNEMANPFRTGIWWKPQTGYTKGELSHWLPPAGAFETGPVAPKKKRRSRKNRR